MFEGVLIGVPVVRNLHERPCEKVLFWVSLLLYVLCLVFAVFWNIFYDDYPDSDRRQCCPFSYNSEDRLLA